MHSLTAMNILISTFALIALIHLSNCATLNELQKESLSISSREDVEPLHKFKAIEPWEGFRGWSPRNPY